MLTYEQALQQVLETVAPLAPVQHPLPEAVGLILAEAVPAHWDMPPCDNSAMDGFAIGDHPDTIQSPLDIVGTAYAGHPFSGVVATGQAVRITTGAPLPAGATSIVPLEDVIDQTTEVALKAPVRPGQHVRRQGEEFRAGELLLEAGTQLHAGEIGLLACAGVAQVLAPPRPRVAIISSGDELVPLGETPGPGRIINSNLYFLMARVRECGGLPIPLGIGEDDPQVLDSLIVEGMKADLLISTGGVSVGEKDLMHMALTKQGLSLIHISEPTRPY